MTPLPKEDVVGPAEAAPQAAPAERSPLNATGQAPRGRPPGGLSPGNVIDGRYRVIRFLNQGGNGVVHEVEHVRTGRRLAMKSLVDDASAARLEQEARATAIMKNPHVVRITDMGPPPGGRGTPYLVMELLEGQSLRDLLEEAGQLPLELTVNIALQVCECLAEAHERKVIHRDLKPDNLFLVKSAWPAQYDVVVLDFGVMKIAGEGPIPKGSLTRTGSTVGTPYYMSLEQLRNSSAVDARADIYSLGVVLYECLAGRKPFVADTIGDLVYALCSGPPTPLARLRPDLPADVCEAIMRALKMNRDERLPSMAELGAALLPHGHPAFGLWLRAGEASPALTMPIGSLQEPAAAKAGAAPALPVPPPRPPLPTAPPPDQQWARSAEKTGTGMVPPAPPATLATPGQLAGPARPPLPLAGSGRAPVQPAPPTPDEGEGTTVTGVGVIRDAIDADAEQDRIPAPPRLDRDTPTEMYKSAAFGGDRETPTRALPTASVADLDAALARSRAAAAAETGDDGIQTFRFEPPRFGSGTERMQGDDARAVQGLARDVSAPLPIPDTLISPHHAPAAAPSASLEVTRAGARADPSRAAFAIEPDDPFRPGWQRSLDKALASVGGFVEGTVNRVRVQPRPMQIAIVGTLVLVVILMMVLLGLLIFR